MTKTQRTSSYLRHMARHHDSHLPLLTPPRMLVQQTRITMPHEIAVETILPTQRSPLVSVPFIGSRKDNRSSRLLQGESIPQNPKASRGNALGTGTIPFSPQLPEFHMTEKTVSIGSKLPQVEILPPPAKSKRIDAVATQATSDRQASASGAEKTARVTLRPRPPQQQETAAITATNRGRTTDFPGQESKAGTINPEQQHATIHIGTIDIHIVPPSPPAPLPPVRGATAQPRSTSALSREMTSFIGLRQG